MIFNIWTSYNLAFMSYMALQWYRERAIDIPPKSMSACGQTTERIS
jgi:hypothetical protein